MTPTPAEVKRRDEVVGAILEDVKAGQAVRLPPLSPGGTAADVAPLLMGSEPNAYGGTLGDYRYQFEGEDDLLHLMVTRLDLTPLSMEEAQKVVTFVVPQVPPGLMWLKPGNRSHHFHFGHDLLLET